MSTRLVSGTMAQDPMPLPTKRAATTPRRLSEAFFIVSSVGGGDHCGGAIGKRSTAALSIGYFPDGVDTSPQPRARRSPHLCPRLLIAERHSKAPASLYPL